MKRLVGVALIAALVVVAAMAVAQTSSEKKTTEAKGSELQSKLEATEKKIWEAFKNKDVAGFKSMVASDMWSVDMSGLMSLDQFMASMNDYTVSDYSLNDFKLVRLGKDAALIVYKANATGSYKGEAVPPGPYYCSSIYANRGGKWLGVFHQETLVQSPAAMMGAKPESK